jgi:microtubule-associated protein-like 5
MKKEKKGQHFLKGINEVIPEHYVQNLAGLADKPNVTYEIDHVYGYAGDRNKSCLYFGQDNNQIVYMTAALGVVHNLTTNTQNVFGGLEKTKMQKKYEKGFPSHQDDITDLHLCPTGGRNMVVTGECGAMSTIHVWDTQSCQSLTQFSLGGSAKGVSSVSMSPCQRYIACVDQSNDHNMSIYNLNRKKMIIQVSAGSDAIFDIQWSKKANDLRFSAVTSRSLQFWNPADATKKLFKNGTFG